MSPASSDWCSYMKRHTDTEEKPGEERGRDARDAATSPGMSRGTRGWEKTRHISSKVKAIEDLKVKALKMHRMTRQCRKLLMIRV